MWTCNDINLLTFSYYLRFILAFNMTIVPFIYIFINIIILIKREQKGLKFNKYFLKNKLKPTFYILIIIYLSLILHNTLNNKENVCYINANTNTFIEYKNSYNKLATMNITTELKTKYLNNVLTKEENINLDNIEKENNKPVVQQISNPIVIGNETDMNKQNQVYVVNGVFYYPYYVYGNNSTYSGMNCASDLVAAGYNNPYGYNNYFYNRLNNMIEEASRNGYKITMSTQGCRSYSTQVYYYNTMTPGRAASPGYSLHGFGIASDLEFYQSDGSICSGYRTDTSCPSMGWAHQNAARFGLTFPLLNASYREDWHIEPINKNRY